MSIYKDSAGSNVGTDNTVVVDINGGSDYSTIKEGIAYLNTLTIGSGERKTLWIRAGSYSEDNSGGPITINERIDIVGEQSSSVFIDGSTAANNLFTFQANGNVNFSNVTFVGPTSGTSIVYDSTGATSARSLNFYNVKFSGMNQTLTFTGSDAQANFYGCSFGPGITTKIGAITDGLVAMLGSQNLNFGAAGFTLAGAGTLLSIGSEHLGCTLVADVTGADAAFLSSGSLYAQCTQVGKAASTGMLLGAGNLHFGTATTELEQAASTATVVWGGTLDFSKLTIASGGDGKFNVYGLNSGTGEIKRRIGTYAGASTITLADSVIVCSTGSVTHTLPAITASSEKFAHKATVINRSNNTVTLSAAGGNTINGGASATIATATSKELIGFGTTWFFY